MYKSSPTSVTLRQYCLFQVQTSRSASDQVKELAIFLIGIPKFSDFDGIHFSEYQNAEKCCINDKFSRYSVPKIEKCGQMVLDRTNNYLWLSLIDFGSCHNFVLVS